ncbi:FHA domain-containing protein [Streptomyces sp. NPDC058735]|uniref:FHA domain-containing protein n=1 Tax=unclassified Streptomyces TaxID=2593676 RepID=UPI003698DAE2
MQIRLTVIDPQAPSAPARDHAPRSDVLVTAPAGTALAAVASALAQVVSGGDGSGTPVLYAGEQRLDAQRCTLGEPPLTDGAVLSVGAPGEPEPHPELEDAPAQLQVVAGPDAGGVHLLHGGEIRIGRSADADVSLDDPDVSRLHCAVTVSADGRVAVADLDSTNGTTLDGARVGSRPVRLAPGALLRIGESALRLAPAGGPGGGRMETAPDGEGHVRVPGPADDAEQARVPGPAPAGPSGPTRHAHGSAARGLPDAGPAEPPAVPGQGGAPRFESGAVGGVAEGPRGDGSPVLPAPGDSAGTGSGLSQGPPRAASGERAAEGVVRAPRQRGAAPAGPGDGDSRAGRSGALGQGGAPGDGRAPGTRATVGSTGRGAAAPAAPRAAAHGSTGPGPSASSVPEPGSGPFPSSAPAPRSADPVPSRDGRTGDDDRDGRAPAAVSPGEPAGHGRKGTPLRGTDVPPGARKRGGLGAWARRLAGGRGEPAATGAGTYEGEPAGTAVEPPVPGPAAPETWPDPAALLLTALGPGPRLWERGPGHPEALAVRLGTADRAAPDGSGLLPAVPVTAGLREVGALGLAGPRARLSGLARAVLAQLAALHSPDSLEIVLIAADRSRSLEERTAEWSWLGWLPHVRPGHGQDCRLLLAHDREQAAARTDELLRRLDDHLADAAAAGSPSGSGLPGAHRGPGRPAGTPAGGGPPAGTSDRADPQATAPRAGNGPRRPSWARDDVPDVPAVHSGPSTVVVVDGDPGGADLRTSVARLALEGPRAGIHVLCLAETAAASPASPVTETYEAACSATPTFRHCGAVALLSGDVATALRLVRVARVGGDGSPAGPVGHGTVATVDAVSPAWAERFARALAPLRTEGTAGDRQPRVSAPLPQSARLLDELGLARATPASLMARWADAADDEALGGRVRAVLGAGPRGPVTADLAAQGPHLLIEGPPGSGRTELLRAVVASLGAAERPDRLGIVLVDGRGGPGEGLRICTDVPHVGTYLTAHDPVLMREFAQSLSAELKRRAELLGRSDFAEWHTGRALSGRMVAQRTASARGAHPAEAGAGDLDSAPSSTLRLRPGAAKRQAEAAAPPLPRLVVVVDDLDALVSPALGSTGRPAAGSVMRALEAVAREGERLGVHLVAATGPCPRTAETEPARRATLRVTLDAPASGHGGASPFERGREPGGEPAPGRGRLTAADGRSVPFQGGRVTGRIPRTATQRPTVVPLEWHRMGDPPARRPVRELGNGPTDLALLASALERAAREVAAARVPSLL